MGRTFRSKRHALPIRTALVLTVALATTGCHFSHVNPNATVTITGRALDTSGKPLAGATVRLFKEADLGEAVVGIVLTVGSLGAVCLLPGAPAVCRQAKTATTGADGSYTFTIKGSDTQGLIGTEATLDAVFNDPHAAAGGPSTTVTFTAKQTTVALPAAQLWSASPRLTEGNDRIGIAWTPLPPSAGSKPSYSAELFDPAREASIWTQQAGARGGDIDARILEDKPANVAGSVRTSLAGAIGAGSVHGVYGSARLAALPIAGAPPSRGRPCLAFTGTTPGGNAGAVAQPTCPVTDGDLLSTGRLSANGKIVTAVAVDLGAARPVHYVVVRGFGGEFLLETSTDGKTYTQVGVGSGSPAAVSVSSASSARFVRVRSPTGLDESLMVELSVW